MSLPPFQHLVDAHWRDVARLAHALGGPLDGDDVAQQAWTQALAAYPSLRSSTNLRSWLLTVTARCATDVHRARARRPVPVADVGDAAEASVGRTGGSRKSSAAPTSVPGPETGITDPALWDAELWDAVRALPGRQRTAVVLRYVVDLDHEGIAAALGTTSAATRRLVSDALTTLRRTR